MPFKGDTSWEKTEKKKPRFENISLNESFKYPVVSCTGHGECVLHLTPASEYTSLVDKLY